MNDYIVAVQHHQRTEQIQKAILGRDGSRARAARIRRRGVRGVGR